VYLEVIKMVNISKVVRNDLCTGCGTCVAICPNEAIKIEINEKKGTYVPKINEVKCNNCSLCYEVCPGHEVDFKELNETIFGEEPMDIMIGNFLNCYIGHSANFNIRYNSSSGGLVTHLLIFALEEGIIDGALVTRMRKDNPLKPEPFIARTKEEIIEASGSKYCPVPANIMIKEILESREGEKFAIVGLPCHIHGVRKAEQINKGLKNKIVLHFGLFCSKCPNFWATNYLLRNFRLNKEDILSFSYRTKGYPGSMHIQLKNGKQFHVNFWDYYDTSFGQFFTPPRCRLCIDFTCELADISFGDAFFEEAARQDKIGTGFVISRTEKGEKFLRSVPDIKIDPIDVKIFDNSRDFNLIFKKSNLNVRGLFLHKPIPTYNRMLINDFHISLYNALFILIYKIGYFIASKQLWELLKLYSTLIKLLSGGLLK
jgi:coenzyme F420 hydrogenase subunit beta